MVDTSEAVTILTKAAWEQSQQQFVMYQYAAVLLACAIIGILFLFKGAWPFIAARFTHQVVVCTTDTITKNIIPNKDFQKINGMFYYKGEPLPFVKNYPGNFRFTGMAFDILDIDIQTIENPMYKKACDMLIKQGYPNIDALEKALLFSMMEEGDPRIHEIITREGYTNYKDAQKKINPKNLTNESPIIKQFFVAIPLYEFMGYGAEIPPDNILGEVNDIYESRKPQEAAKRKIMEFAPYIAIMIAFAVIAAVAYKILVH